MDREELIERLNGYEWKDVEFKRARRGVPESAYETVSAFCNTEGGWLVFGVQDNAGRFEVAGVVEVDKVQNDFLSTLRSGQKLNRVIATKENRAGRQGPACVPHTGSPKAGKADLSYWRYPALVHPPRRLRRAMYAG